MDYPFTAIPKWFFPLVPELSEAELRIMLVVWNQTTGWQADSNTLAYTYLAEQTGMTGTSAISRALKSLEKRGLIKRQAKRMNGQLIQVFPETPILPIEVLLQEESGLLQKESVTPLKGVSDSSKRSHNRNTMKESFKDTNTMLKFTPDQEESLALLVGVGLEKDISRQLIVKAWENGRDSEYIKQVVGYVNSISAKNPPGMVRSLIERNSGRIPVLEAAQGPESAKRYSIPPVYHFYDNGTYELEQHPGERRDCPICSERVNGEGK